MSDWRSSHYNFSVDTPDGWVVLFNSLSGRTRYFPQKTFLEKIAPVLDSRPENGRSDPELVAELARDGFVRKRGDDELVALKRDYRNSQYRGERMSLTIVPSQDCNFSCDYCFEKERSGRMSRETAKQVAHFCEEWIYPRTEVFVCWYGGEPLLALDTLDWLAGELRSKLERKHCNLQGTIITNGYLLDTAAVERLLAAGIASAQVTLDGDVEAHDRYRSVKDGTPTFERIFANIVAAARAGLHVNLRINAGRHNEAGLFSVVDRIAGAGIRKKVSISLGRLDDLCGNSGAAARLALDNTAFADLEYRLLLRQLTLGFPVRWKGLMPRATYCSAVRPSFLMITHDGRIGKCWNRAGNEMEPVGHVSRPGLVLDRQDPHIGWDPFAVDECRECPFFPLCAGGCPDRNLRDPATRVCDSIRFNLTRQLRLKYLCERTGLSRL